MREEMHRILSEYFPNRKDYAVRILLNEEDIDEIIKQARDVKGKKFNVKFRDLDIKHKLLIKGVKDSDFYTAMLDYISKKYSKEEIHERIKEWKRESILRYV